MEAVRNSTDTELTNYVHERSEVDSDLHQNREEVENKIGNITHEVKSVASSLEDFNSSIQMDKRNYQL